DANGNTTTRTLLAGTGHGGGEALVARQWNADGGTIEHGYDVFGDLRKLTDPLDAQQRRRVTRMTYDGMGRLTAQTRAQGTTLALTDHYGYDILGQRITHWNDFLNPDPANVYNVERTDYDAMGRVTRTQGWGGNPGSGSGAGGDVTTFTYTWQAGLQNTGLTGNTTAIGGWLKTTTHANTRTSSETTDLYGHVIASEDMGGFDQAFTYDRAGRVTGRSGAGDQIVYGWLNTGLAGSVTSVGGGTTLATYGYDANGNRTAEKTVIGGVTRQNATAVYDALGRMTSWADAGGGATPSASIAWEYDAVGNIRRTLASYRTLDRDNSWNDPSTSEQWYRFDTMNRMVTAEGKLTAVDANGDVVTGDAARGLAGAAIVRGQGFGIDLLYDQAGRRVQATRTIRRTQFVVNPAYIPPDGPTPYGGAADVALSGGVAAPEPLMIPPGTGGTPYINVAYAAENREEYAYDAAGNLIEVAIAESSAEDNGDGGVIVTPPGAAGTTATFGFDKMGRQLRQTDLGGAQPKYERVIAYNAKGQVASETVISLQAVAAEGVQTDTFRSITTNNYGSGSGYALGAVVTSSTTNAKWSGSAWQSEASSSTSNTYHWYAGAELYRTSISRDGQTQVSTYNRDGAGVLESVAIADGRPRTIAFANDVDGLAIARDESDNDPGHGDPHERWYRFAGRELGAIGNNGTTDVDYKASLGLRTRAYGTTWYGSGAFRSGQFSGLAHGDFADGYDAITSYEQGSEGGGYVVRGGETLASIAAMQWGDASLWYKLAEANGLAGDPGSGSGAGAQL
ncbi:hypothetical protein D1610_16785, partial [Sphingomonas gilva]